MCIINDVMKKYSKIKNNNEYFLNSYGKIMNCDDNMNVLSTKRIKKIPSGLHVFSKNLKRRVGKDRILKNLPPEIINRLHPDNIDNSKFWKHANELFPLFTISGNSDCKTIKDVNYHGLYRSKILGGIDEVDRIFSITKDAKFLEIGPGYGNILFYIRSKFSDKEYCGIDINPVYKDKKIIKCDGKNIPNNVGENIDLVYSLNVFQHLSKKQRSSYYKQIYYKLKKGGRFVFDMFLVTPKNVNEEYLWGYKDKNGRCYCNMLSQLIEIDREDEILKELTSLGFKKIKHKEYKNGVFFILEK